MTSPAGPGGDPDDWDGSDDGEDRDDVDRPRGLIRSLLDLLREMEERGEKTRSGHRRTGPRTSVDFSVSIGDLSDVGDGGPFDAGGRGRRRDAASDESTGDGSEEASEPHVTTRETTEGLVVAADLPGVDESAVETRLDEEAEFLVIEVSGRDAARLPLESEGWMVVDDRFANGVLEVELRRE